MKQIIKIKNKEITLDTKDLTTLEIENIQAKIDDEFKRLEDNKIIDTITQFAILIAKYAIELYIKDKETKLKNEEINLKLDSLIKITKEEIQKETLF